MKRDMELVRDLLLKIEAEGAPALDVVPAMAGFDEGVVIEHVRLCYDAGLISAIDATTLDGRDYMELELTWYGHEFVDQIRDPEIWAKTKAGASKVGSWSIGIIGELAVGFIKAKAATLGLPIG